MNKLKSLAGETVLYGLGSIIPRFLNFLLVILHTDVFNPEEYGVITKLFAYVAVVNILFMFGMETAFFRFATKAGADAQRMFNLAQTFVISISLVLSIGLILLANPVADLLNIPGHSDLVIWLVLIMFIDAVVAIPFAELRLHKKAKAFAIGKLVNIAVLVGLNIYFLKISYDPSLGIGFVVLANLAANAFYLVFFARKLISWKPTFDVKISKEIFVYAYPVMLMGLAGMTNEMFSRITLEWWLPENFYTGQTSDYALGVFGASYKFAVLMSLVVQAFRYAAEPFFFSNAADKNSPQLFARVNHLFIVACCILLLAVGINLDVLKFFLQSEAYWEGLNVVPVLLLAYLFLGAYYNMSVWYKLTDKTYYGTLITVGGVGVTFLLNYLLIPHFGYYGSSWATFGCYFLMAVACYFLGKKHYPIPYTLARSMAYILVTILLVYGVNAIIIPSFWGAILFHAGIILVYVAVAWWLERKNLKPSPVN